MKCKACGSDFTLLEYQARSADEAQEITYRCPLCPLDIVKFSNPINEPHLYLKRLKRSYRKTPTIDSTNQSYSRFLYVTVKDSRLFQNHELLTAKCSNSVDSDSKLFKTYSDGPWKGMSIHHGIKTNVGLNACVVSVSLTTTSVNEEYQYTDFKYTNIEGYTVIVENNAAKLVHDVGIESDSSVLEHLHIAYTIGFAPMNLSSYVDPIFLGAVSNMSARAYDAASGNDYTDKFSTKPDGERMWLARAGSTWLYCKRLSDFEIRSWEIDNTLQYTDGHSISPVIDIEFMLHSKPILIDILVGSNKKVCPYDRTLQWIEAETTSLCRDFEYARNIEKRKFFDTYKEAYAYAKTVSYPIDGLVAISSDGTDMKKLKPTKSVELRLQENKDLVTREGRPLFRVTGECTYATNDIIEVRFSLCGSKLTIKQDFHRPDKTLPNDNSAVQSIIASCSDKDSESMLRTAVWRWSNKLRFYLYEKANSMDNDKNIILDIGSGAGQSSEAFDKMSGCSFILVEPDEAACKSLSYRLRTRDVHKDPRSVIGAIPQLKRGTKKYHILNCQIEDILSDKPVLSNMRNILKCAVSCFSAHYVMESVDEIVSLGVPFVGCYYSYNGINIGESILRTSSIQMTRVSYETALVKWGHDKSYDEPVVLPEHEPISVDVLNGVDIVPLDSVFYSETANIACSSVRVLISN